MSDAVLIIGVSLLAVPFALLLAVGCVVTFAMLQEVRDTARFNKRLRLAELARSEQSPAPSPTPASSAASRKGETP